MDKKLAKTRDNNNNPKKRTIRKKFDVENVDEKVLQLRKQPVKRLYEDSDSDESDDVYVIPKTPSQVDSSHSSVLIDSERQSRFQAKKSKIDESFEDFKEFQTGVINSTLEIEQERKREATYLTKGISELIGNLKTVLKVQTENEEKMEKLMTAIVNNQAQVILTTDATIKALQGVLGRFVSTMESVEEKRRIRSRDVIDQCSDELEILKKKILEDGRKIEGRKLLESFNFHK